MSSPDAPRQIIQAPRARQDFIDILRYTGETWGPKQLEVYRDKIDQALQLLARNPGLGHHRPICPTPTAPIWWARISSSTATTRPGWPSSASCTRE